MLHARSVLLLCLLAGCAAPPAEPVGNPLPGTAAAPAAATPEPAAPPRLAWPRAGSCAGTAQAVLGLAAEERERLDPAGSPLALAVVDHGMLLEEPTALRHVTLDLPLPVAAGPAALGAYPCVLLVERSPSVRAAPRRTVGHEIVRSAYRRGLDRTPNPERAALQRRVRELDRRDDGLGIMPTGDPGIDLIGLLAGGVLDAVGGIGRAREREEARAALADTPASLATPLWEPYTYEVSSVEAQRAGWLRAALLDGVEGRAWPLRRDVQEAVIFRVASGRHAKDRALLEGQGGAAATAGDVLAWESGGLRPVTSQVLALLAEAARAAPGEAMDFAGLLGRWQAETLPTLAEEASPEPPTARRRARGANLVEEVAGADGERRYRLAEPAPVPDEAEPEDEPFSAPP
jgi:hypothetical protein